MDKCTHEVRMKYWKNIIFQCQNRPEGQSAKEWMQMINNHMEKYLPFRVADFPFIMSKVSINLAGTSVIGIIKSS